MNTKHISLAFVTAAALLAGCAKSTIEEEVIPFEQPTDLELAYVGATETKAAVDGTTFPKTGEIGLFLFKDEAAIEDYGTGYKNVKYSYNSTKDRWTASPSIKVGSTPGYLYGYYPYDSESTDIKAIPVASSLNGNDVMYASKQAEPITEKAASSTSIVMNHALARVSITVVNKGYTGEAKLTKIKLSGAEIAPDGTLNALDGSITAEKSSVTLDVTGDAQTITAGGTLYECLLVPSGTISTKQELDLTLTIDGNDKQAELSGDNGVIIAKGTKSNITITVSDSGISVQTVSVEDWNVVEVGGHTVTVKLAEVSGIEKDIMITAYVEGTSVIIKAQAESGRAVECVLPEDKLCDYTKNNNIYTFTIPDITADLTATVGYVVVRSVSLNKEALDLIKDHGHYRLIATVLPEDAWDKTLIWSTSDESVATVDQNGFVKAFATGSATITVQTKSGGYTATCVVTVVEPQSRPNGSLPGHFSVSDSTVVYFSKGNLYCSGAGFNDDGTVKTMEDATWEFEAHQYDTTPSKNDVRDLDHISHFMWCKEAKNSLHLWYEDSWDVDGVYIFTNEDATTPNPAFTVNGQTGIWRVLSGGDSGEWKYLINRNNGTLYKSGVKVNGHTDCLILLPDDWKWDANTVGAEWQTEYSESTTVTWQAMESAGAVCLPPAGYRRGDGIFDVGDHGLYSSSTSVNNENTSSLIISSSVVSPNHVHTRKEALAIRLVTESK